MGVELCARWSWNEGGEGARKIYYRAARVSKKTMNTSGGRWLVSWLLGEGPEVNNTHYNNVRSTAKQRYKPLYTLDNIMPVSTPWSFVVGAICCDTRNGNKQTMPATFLWELTEVRCFRVPFLGLMRGLFGVNLRQWSKHFLSNPLVNL